MRTITTNVFQFNELSEAAKKTAIAWFQSTIESDDISRGVYDDAIAVAALFGLTIEKIYFTGFSSQGDGACFEGGYRYVSGALKAVKNYAPNDTELHSIVERLAAVQGEYSNQLRATCEQRGHYHHSGCMTVNVWDDENQYNDIGGAEDTVTALLRLFADWIYSRLSENNNYLMSDTAVIESIEANEYEFYADGSKV